MDDRACAVRADLAGDRERRVGRRVGGAAASTFSVTVTFNADGAAKMFRATQSHIGRPLAMLVDGEVVIAPVVRSPITTSAIISGNYTRAEAERIVAGILGR